MEKVIRMLKIRLDELNEILKEKMEIEEAIGLLSKNGQMVLGTPPTMSSVDAAVMIYQKAGKSLKLPALYRKCRPLIRAKRGSFNTSIEREAKKDNGKLKKIGVGLFDLSER